MRLTKVYSHMVVRLGMEHAELSESKSWDDFIFLVRQPEGAFSSKM